MEVRYILLLHALCLMMTVGVAWMSYAFAAIEDTVERRDEVFGILLGFFSAFLFAGAGAALIWATRERRDMAFALIMMLVMILIMHAIVRLATVILDKSSRLALYTFLGSFTLVVYCIISLVIFAPSDTPVFKTFRAIQNNTTGQLPIKDWDEKRGAVLRALSDEMQDHNQAFQAAAQALKGLSRRPEYRQVLDICKDAVSVMDDEKAQVRALKKVIDVLIDPEFGIGKDSHPKQQPLKLAEAAVNEPVKEGMWARLKGRLPFGKKQSHAQPQTLDNDNGVDEPPPPPPQRPPVIPARAGNQHASEDESGDDGESVAPAEVPRGVNATLSDWLPKQVDVEMQQKKGLL